MKSKHSIFTITAAAFILVTACLPTAAQKRNKRPVTAKEQAPAVKPVETEAAPQRASVPAKRNERPAGTDDSLARNQQGSAPTTEAAQPGAVPAYRYEFSQPDFVVPAIKIEHDEQGRGTISFKKKGEDEMITDPISVSPKSITRIDEALTALNFLDSTENYQYEKDFAHLGNIKFARTREGRSREVAFNWTSNKDAKTLMDEYRKIANQYIWVFDIKLSRENQPLEAPRLFDTLDSMIRRNEISDPYQMQPFLLELSNDERIPLIARNHAAKLIKQFEKEKAKEEKKKPDGSK